MRYIEASMGLLGAVWGLLGSICGPTSFPGLCGLLWEHFYLLLCLNRAIGGSMGYNGGQYGDY